MITLEEFLKEEATEVDPWDYLEFFINQYPVDFDKVYTTKLEGSPEVPYKWKVTKVEIAPSRTPSELLAKYSRKVGSIYINPEKPSQSLKSNSILDPWDYLELVIAYGNLVTRKTLTMAETKLLKEGFPMSKYIGLKFPIEFKQVPYKYVPAKGNYIKQLVALSLQTRILHLPAPIRANSYIFRFKHEDRAKVCARFKKLYKEQDYYSLVNYFKLDEVPEPIEPLDTPIKVVLYVGTEQSGLAKPGDLSDWHSYLKANTKSLYKTNYAKWMYGLVGLTKDELLEIPCDKKFKPFYITLEL